MENIYACADDLLQKTKQTSFPIDIEAVTEYLNATVMNYSEARQHLEKLGLWEYAQSKEGFCLLFLGNYYIYYWDKLPYTQRRFVLAHECAHISLGHHGLDGVLGKSSNASIESKQEDEANAFALALQANIPLLTEKNIDRPRQATRLSEEHAKMVAGHILSTRPINPLNWVKPVLCIAVIFALLIAGASKAVQHSDNGTPPVGAPSATEENLTVAVSTIVEATPSATIQPSPTASTVYWTKGGSVYHLNPDCYTLAQAKYPLENGTVEDSHKSRICSRCKEWTP